jgi:hypothetical protein
VDNGLSVALLTGLCGPDLSRKAELLDAFETGTSVVAVPCQRHPGNTARRPSVRAAVCAVSRTACWLGLILVATANAELKPMPGGSPLILKGKAGEDITGRVDLISTEAVTGLIFRSEDLVQAGGSDSIGRQQIALAITGDLNIPANTPKYFDIKITGVKTSGKFKGNFFFLETGKGSTPALTIPVEVNIDPVAKLAVRKGSDTVKLQLIDCYWLGCSLARWFEPRAFVSSYPVLLDDNSIGTPSVSVAVAAVGDTTHSSMTGVLVAPSPSTAGSSPIFEYRIEVNANAHPKPLPDHYTGDFQVKSSLDTLARVPIDVNVRTGPGVPLLVLVCGILLGRLIKYMKDKGGPQSELLLRLYSLEGRIATSPVDQQILQPMLEGVKQQIYAMQLDQGKTELAAIENRWTLLGTLRGLDRTLTPRAGDAGVQDILDRIVAARGLIALKRDQEAAGAIAQIQTLVQNLGREAPAVPAFALAAAEAGTACAVAGRVANAVGPEPTSRVARLMSIVTGVSAEFRAGISLWLLRPIGYLVLIAFLAVIGMQQLYLKNATFGADPFSDYFGLLIWAMSSDVASRTLSSLKTN